MKPIKKVVCFPLKEEFHFNNKFLKWDMDNLQFKGFDQAAFFKTPREPLLADNRNAF